MTDKFEIPADRTNRWPLVVFFILTIVAVPWYWPVSNYAVYFGVPGWVALAVLVSLIASIFAAWLLSKPWPSELSESTPPSDLEND